MSLNVDEMQQQVVAAESYLKQLANKNRLMILCSLLDKKLSVSELNELVPLSQSALSQHLAKLRQAGFVQTERQSQTIYYKVCDPKVAQIIENLYTLFCQEG